MNFVRNLFFIVLFTTAMFSCTSDQSKGEIAMRLEKLHYTSTQGELSVTTFSYDDTGRLESSILELADGTVVHRISIATTNTAVRFKNIANFRMD